MLLRLSSKKSNVAFPFCPVKETQLLSTVSAIITPHIKGDSYFSADLQVAYYPSVVAITTAKKVTLELSRKTSLMKL